MVRYKIALDESTTISGLAECFLAQPELLESMRVLVWDNSPVKLIEPKCSFPFDYRFSDDNLGVSGGYNAAMAWAEQIGCPWLMLLDQDTKVAGEYLGKMLEYTFKLQQESQVAAIVPFVSSQDMLISPQHFGRFIRNHQVPIGVSGLLEMNTGAINSGTVMRVSALRRIGGYSNLFWLDLSDVYVFTMLYRSGFKIYLAGDLQLNHSLANLDYNNNMSPERYNNFLAAENTFYEMFKPPLSRLVYTFWLLARTARQYKRFERKIFARLTFAAFCQRVFTSRASRMKKWEDALNRRSIPALSSGKIVG